MDNKAIETLAISAVKDSIVSTEILDQFIADNDKEPSWDGFIYVYNGKRHTKKCLAGRVPVQVKGKLVDSLPAKRITYPVDISDLINYKNDVGVVFFVVCLNRQNPLERKIYYEELTPVKIANYLKQADGQKKKHIQLYEFPNEKELKSVIIADFLFHSKRQASFSTQGFISFEELQKSNIPYQFSITLPGNYSEQSSMFYSELYNRGLYVYITLEGSNTLLPTDIIATSLRTTETVVNDIKVNGSVFYTDFQRIRTLEGVTLKIGHSFSLIMKYNSNDFEAKIELSPMLRWRAKDLSFLISAMKVGKFHIGNAEITMVIPPKESSIFDITTQEQLLLHYNEVIHLLDTLHIRKDINLADLTDRQKKDFDILVKAILLKQKVNIKVKISPCIFDLKLGNLKIRLLIEKDKQTQKCVIYDFFNLPLDLFGSLTIDGTPAKISPYSILKDEDYLELANINYEEILNSYKSLVHSNPEVYNLANNNILYMLLAYDKNFDTKLLNTARDIINWLCQEKAIDPNIILINKLQIIKRERNLNNDELVLLNELIENPMITEDIKVGAYLLLGNKVGATIHFSKLSLEDQDLFKKYPIYKFWL